MSGKRLVQSRAELRRLVATASANPKILIYCGCCPLEYCSPALEALAELQRMGIPAERIEALNFRREFDEKSRKKG